jgi:hypothetical protein
MYLAIGECLEKWPLGIINSCALPCHKGGQNTSQPTAVLTHMAQTFQKLRTNYLFRTPSSSMTPSKCVLHDAMKSQQGGAENTTAWESDPTCA